jgi:molecular chaperone DnaJ
MDYYEIFGLKKNASHEDIKERYKILAKKYHPDVAEIGSNTKNMFILIQEAYEVIGDLKKRAIYDMSMGYTKGQEILQDGEPPTISHPFFNFFSAMRLYRKSEKVKGKI